MTRPNLPSENISRRSPIHRIALGLALVILLGFASSVLAEEASPCQRSLDALGAAYENDERTRAAFQAAYDGLQPLPPGYTYDGSSQNPWKRTSADGAGLAQAMIDFYDQVCTLLPRIVGTNDNALDSIQYFAWLYFHNEAGRQLVEGVDPNDSTRPLTSVRDFLILFNQDYKAYMDSAESQQVVAEWIADPRLEIEDYVKTLPSQYRSWNEFFARNLEQSADGRYPSRPVTMAERDYVIVSPTDCIMNPLVQILKTESGDIDRRLIENPLQYDTVLDVKGIPLTVSDLLANAPERLKAQFAGGSGLACVLMPNTYHHFHSPVDGEILYHEIVEAGTPDAWGTFGYDDWPNWVPLDGNVGRPGTDFSQFQGFTRGVIIVRVSYDNLPNREPKKLHGYVASIPVGLDTVGSVVFADDVKTEAHVTKGVTPFGNFFFGGRSTSSSSRPSKGRMPRWSARPYKPAWATRSASSTPPTPLRLPRGLRTPGARGIARSGTTITEDHNH